MGELVWVGATLTGTTTVALVGAIALIVRAGLVRIPPDHPDVHLDLDQLFFDRFGHQVSEPVPTDGDDTPGSQGDPTATDLFAVDYGPPPGRGQRMVPPPVRAPHVDPHSAGPARPVPRPGGSETAGCSQLGPAA